MNPLTLGARIRKEFTFPENASLPEWRTYFLNTTLIFVWLLGLLSYVVVLRITLVENDLALDIIFTAAVLMLTMVTFVRRLPFKFRVGVLLFINYALALVVFYSLGLVSSGRMYLYTASILAVVFVGLKAGLFSVALNTAVLIFLLWQVSQGRLSYDPPQMVNNWITTSAVFVMLNVFTTVSVGLLVRALAANLEVMQDLTRSLEQRVAERTRVVEAGVKVSRALSGVLDATVPMQEVVEQIHSAFDYYHTQIYLLDEAQDKLLLTGGTGDPGQMMLAAGHSVLLGQGIVGQAAALNEYILVPDVRQDERWQPNPLLPETKAETAVPIAIGDEVWGVLDVQVAQVNGLSEDDVSFLQAIAGQVAVAIRNARLYEATEYRVQYEAQVNMISQKIQQAATLEEVLQIAAQELEQALGAQRVTVQLGGNGSAS